MVTPIFATLIFDQWWACLNLSGISVDKDARTLITSAPGEPEKTLG
ncbi:hypothetical protein MDN04_004223 [Salmonella enterica]|nr:hypothetical protein [Salmonella enterica]EIW4249642.1 hypothetical protein [Salmonella enterica]EIY5616283.1 hypothetical protein [Salmonella enterica]EJA6067054.1 hypothetical protein [Salmonella enterica]EJA6099561.1 hypothetical protein [Salmonella enterica]